jgi:hypothetical protein
MVLFLLVSEGKIRWAALPDRGQPRMRDYDFSGASSRWIRAGVYWEEGAMHVLLVWAEQAADVTRIRSQSISPGKPLEEPRLLIERTSPLAALAVQPVARTGRPEVYAVFARQQANGEATAIRASTSDDPVSIPLPDAPVVEWAIDAQHWPPIVAASTANQIRCWSNGGWRVLASDAAKPQRLRLVEAIQPWAVWADADKGIQYVTIP